MLMVSSEVRWDFQSRALNFICFVYIVEERGVNCHTFHETIMLGQCPYLPFDTQLSLE